MIGDWIAWWVVHPSVRRESERQEVATLPALLGTIRFRRQRLVIMLAGLMTFVLLGVYAAAQLRAGVYGAADPLWLATVDRRDPKIKSRVNYQNGGHFSSMRARFGGFVR